MLDVIAAICLFIWYLVIIAISFTVALMLVRLIITSADVNPFTWTAINTRRLSDPLINPVRRALMRANVQPKYAPLVTILLVILVGYLVVLLTSSVLNTLASILVAAREGAIIVLIGLLLYGLLSFYSLLIFIRIILAWGTVSYAHGFMRFAVNATDPLLVPLRKRIPPVGMFDVSPLVAFIIIWLCQAAIQGTLLRGFRMPYVC
jgi:YggT family protein